MTETMTASVTSFMFFVARILSALAWIFSQTHLSQSVKCIKSGSHWQSDPTCKTKHDDKRRQRRIQKGMPQFNAEVRSRAVSEPLRSQGFKMSVDNRFNTQAS